MNLTITNQTCEDIIFNGHYLEKLYFGNDLVWEKQHAVTGELLKFTATERNSTIKIHRGSGAPERNFKYSLDNGNTWNDYTFGSIESESSTLDYYPGALITLSTVGSSVMFKCSDGHSLAMDRGRSSSHWFVMTGKISASGDVTSLINGAGGNINLSTITAYSSTIGYHFCHLFYHCTSLTTAPNLPSTIVAASSYYSMFAGCTSLTTAPTLPATTLAYGCYEGMFASCSALTTAPTLPTTLQSRCYAQMFAGCTSLTTAPVLSSMSLATNCYYRMFAECTALTTAPDLPATTLVSGCYSDMFYGCTSLITAPELPATKLEYECYYEMFWGCTSLNKVTCLATDISGTRCLYGWLYNVSATGTFVKNPSMTSWPSGGSGIPTNWTVQDYS